MRRLSALFLLLLCGCSSSIDSNPLWSNVDNRQSKNVDNQAGILWEQTKQQGQDAQREFRETWDKNLQDTQRDINQAHNEIYAQIIPFQLPAGGEFKLPELAAPEIEFPGFDENSAPQTPSEAPRQDAPPVNQVTDQVVKVYSGGAGSGVVVGNSGQIITNAHVLSDRTSVNVVANGNTYPAQIIRVDDINDLALIQISADTTNPATFGSANVGDPVTTIGNPLNKGITERTGSISKSQTCIPYGSRDGKEKYTGLNQAQATCQFTSPGIVNPGNSGGGAFNQNGELIGIVSAETPEGYGMLIPADIARSIL